MIRKAQISLWALTLDSEPSNKIDLVFKRKSASLNEFLSENTEVVSRENDLYLS